MQTFANPVARESNACSLEHLSDGELLASTRRLVGRSNQLLAELLAHLGEVEARGIHRTRACSSLYTYCQYELRFSEDEAFRRVAAARLVRRFPALLDALASGELHLTGLLLLGPHLTPENLTEVLARAKHRSKRELLRLVRVLDPLPAVPARIEPLGPAPARVVPATPQWETFVHATCPVRDLAPGERPRDWMEGANDCALTSPAGDDQEVGLPPRASTRASAGRSDALVPGRYKVQFTASEEYVQLVEQAKALLSHASPRVTLEELQLRAMRALVTELSKKEFGCPQGKPATDAPHAREHQHNEPAADAPQARGHQHTEQTTRRLPRQRGRYIPAAVRRAVLERDGARCTYVAATGERCAETQRLEFHHLQPFARSGNHTVSNLSLRCAAHNALAAEEDFGRSFMEEKIRDSSIKGPGE